MEFLMIYFSKLPPMCTVSSQEDNSCSSKSYSVWEPFAEVPHFNCFSTFHLGELWSEKEKEIEWESVMRKEKQDVRRR